MGKKHTDIAGAPPSNLYCQEVGGSSVVLDLP